ncbi:MAG: PDZ domain-containing protein [Bryobacteraceae bacterium]
MRTSRPIRCFFAALVVSLVLPAFPAPARASTDNRGTVGIYFAQLFDENQRPTHRGPLVVLQVVEESPAAKAGIHSGDFVVAVNGAPVPGREIHEIINKDIHGPIGGTLRLTVVKPDGSQSEYALVRAPYPPHSNPASDPFVYTVPGSWGTDPRYQFPLPWSPKLPYHGFEDLFYAPDFAQTDAPEYHSYLFFLWLEGSHMLSAQQLQSDIVTYFRGLAEERGRTYGFTPDLSKVSATYEEDLSNPWTLGGAPARAFKGTATIWDTHGKVITLNSEVLISGCRTSSNTAFFAGMSLEPRNGDMWKQLDAIRDTFRCSR